MTMQGPIDQFVTRTPKDKMSKRRMGVNKMLNRLALQQPVGKMHLQVMLCSTSGWPILDLPVEMMEHILSFLDLENGATVTTIRRTSRFFRQLIGRPDVIRRSIPRAKGLNPRTIVVDLSNNHVHDIPSCDTLVLYSSKIQMSRWINATSNMEKVGCICVRSDISAGSIRYLYTMLDRMKHHTDLITVVTKNNYGGLLDQESEYISRSSDGTYEIRIPSSVSKNRLMFPATRFIRALIN